MTESGFSFIRDEPLASGQIVTLNRSYFRGPDGSEFVRDVVRHPGAVSAVAIDGDELYLVRQYRAAIDDYLWETPAGKKDVAGEDPELTIRRELEEEIGMLAGSVKPLMLIHQSPGFCDEDQIIYIATDLSPVPQRLEGIEEENMVVERFHHKEAISMCLDGRITDAKSICGILGAARELSW